MADTYLEHSFERVPDYREMRFTYGIERAYLQRFQRMDRMDHPVLGHGDYRENLWTRPSVYHSPTAALVFAGRSQW